MKLVTTILLLLVSANVLSAEWISLEPKDNEGVEVFPSNFSSGIAAGVYFVHKSSFVSSETCSTKKFVAITDPKLADQALSIGMFALASNKTITLWVDGCSNNYLHGKAIKILP
ncbi:hypothetical protein L1D15_21405 [Vibrio sp. Isolate25]|uniref:hypothetical protein n=1 Tax=Vibrio sp. Isolate25 TaxID=2908535 RepID=UPI001EFC6D97|nr:hypothetical protein [Vibrio sp. Isolate25]MCG9599250.1 hypothetical protein [Vibrio sp. Isolate25]